MELLNFNFGAPFYYELGLKYKDRGWTEASRILLTCSEWSNPWNPYSKKAAAFKKVRLPKNNVSPKDQERNIDAYNMDAAGSPEEAAKQFEQLIKDCPNFEWPYNNLANIRLDQGRAEEAEVLCQRALNINPDYANAHITLALALSQLHKDELARKHQAAADKLLAELN